MDTIRAVDKHGRIKLPKEVCKSLGIFEGDEFDITTEGINIVLVRHTKTCLACNDDTDVQRMNRAFLCGECREVISKSLRGA